MSLAGHSEQAAAPVNRRGWWSAAFVGLLGTWVLLNGLDFIVVGVLTAAVAAILPARVASSHLPRVRPVQVVPFLGYFVVESLRGAIDVASRAVRPSMPLDPGFFRCSVDLPPGLPRGLFMGILSLLPGTLSVDLEDDERTLVFHSLVGDPTDAARELESRVARLFHPTGP